MRPSGESLTNYVALLWVEAGQPWFTERSHRSNKSPATNRKKMFSILYVLRGEAHYLTLFYSSGLLRELMSLSQ